MFLQPNLLRIFFFVGVQEREFIEIPDTVLKLRLQQAPAI